MNVARDFHTATLLPNGKVFLAGGFNPLAGGLNTAELFDPTTATFALLPNTLTTKRYYHSATLLPNGKVFLAGGGGSAPPILSGSVIANTAELFDPATNSFTPIAQTMNSYRYWQTATLLSTGKVLLANGSSADYAGAAFTRTAELFDPVTQTFALLPLMNSIRFGHTATLLPNGQVLLAAGTTGSTATNTAEIFDEGLGFAEVRRPLISTSPSSLGAGGPLTLTGSRFRGDSEGSFSSFQSSATNYPLLELRKIDNEQSFFIRSDPNTNWSDSAFTSVAINNLPAGQYRLTIFTNAIPSQSQIVSINPVQLKIVSITRQANGHVMLQCLGAPSVANTVEATFSLTSAFESLNNAVVADSIGAFEFEDSAAANYSQRFYRLGP
jgi:hypothetical protein